MGQQSPVRGPVRNSQTSSSPDAWDDPRWKEKLLLEHHPQQNQLYRALNHCHKQGQCCPLPRTSSMSMSSGPPDRKGHYEKSRKELKTKNPRTKKQEQNQQTLSGSRATLEDRDSSMKATSTSKERYGTSLAITRPVGLTPFESTGGFNHVCWRALCTRDYPGDSRGDFHSCGMGRQIREHQMFI